jgi:hypothetical protein
MSRAAVAFVLLTGCVQGRVQTGIATRPRARPPAAAISATEQPATVEAFVGHTEYGLCEMLIITTPCPELAEASQHFRRAADDLVAGRRREAGGGYLSGATALRRSEAHGEPDVVYNRRVAYANGINLWLSLGSGLIEEARRALLLAAVEDADLAGELHAAAGRLPAAMSCVPR